TARRVVVGRDLQRFGTSEAVAPLVAYLRDPLPTTALVLVWPSGRVPKPLLDTLKAAGGEQVDTAPGRGWVADQLKQSNVVLDRGASDVVTRHLGEDVARLRGLLETLEATFGPGARLGLDEVAPYLGEAGGVAPWDLTDAIDRGDITASIETLHRMMGAGERHALVVLATVHTHFGRMLALEGADVRGEKDAAALLGLRGSTFPARKALSQATKLGYDRVARAIQLLARADLDLKGQRNLPDEVVMDVLVARLAALAR
ncbi:MAG: DNA polymerase III subunit delta, partial [Acidimicrobiales bacterium]